MLVGLTDYSGIQLILLTLIAIFELIFIIWYKPFENPVDNFNDTKKWFIIMSFNYHMQCLTHFVPDPTMKYYVGVSAVTLVLADISLTIMLWLKSVYKIMFYKMRNSAVRIWLYLRKTCIKKTENSP